MPWLTRGLRQGVVTTGYPRRRDGYGPAFAGSVTFTPERSGLEDMVVAAAACPTGAIELDGAVPRLDRGRCILCARCAQLAPEAFRLVPDFETSAIARGQLAVPQLEGDEEQVGMVRQALESRVRALRRSVHVRHIDVGSDGSEEWEVAALNNPVYDVERLGIFFTASPRHADILLATGVGSAGMAGPLKETFDAMPCPKVVIAAGVDAISGGLVGKGYASNGGICGLVPVDVFVPGSPPSPFGLLFGILLATGRLRGYVGPSGVGAQPGGEAVVPHPGAVVGEPA